MVMLKPLVLSLAIVFGTGPVSEAYNILGICGAPTQSHWVTFEAVMRALSDAGHNVTILGMRDSRFHHKPNHEVINLDGLIGDYFDYFPAQLSDIKGGADIIYFIIKAGLGEFDMMMRHEKMQRFMAEGHRHYDLVIVESFGTEAFYGFGEHFNAPLIALSTTVATGWLNMAVGNAEPWSSVPNQFLQAQPEMSFNDRFNNVLLNLYEYYYVTRLLLPQGDQLLRQHFPGNQRSLQQVVQEGVCLGFVNDHFTLSLPRPKSPNMIEIGGIHLDVQPEDDGQGLDAEIRAFLEDSGEHGVIVFSLGSILRASELPDNVRAAFVASFGKLKHRVIWRYDLPDADRLPKNILARAWLPQAQILAHPNVKLFISHGGKLGTTEAVAAGVPLLGIPFFGDQHVNIARAVHRGYARLLSRFNVTEASLNEAFGELLGNPSFLENAQKYSRAFHDQPMSPAASVVYWSEYVIRHKCPEFVKVASARMNWVQSANLDVWTCIAVMAVCVISVLWLLLRVIVSALCHMSDKLKME